MVLFFLNPKKMIANDKCKIAKQKNNFSQFLSSIYMKIIFYGPDYFLRLICSIKLNFSSLRPLPYVLLLISESHNVSCHLFSTCPWQESLVLEIFFQATNNLFFNVKVIFFEISMQAIALKDTFVLLKAIFAPISIAIFVVCCYGNKIIQ